MGMPKDNNYIPVRFEDTGRLADAKVREMGIDKLNFTEQVLEDITGDGIKDRFSLEVVESQFVGVDFKNGKYRTSYFYDLCHVFQKRLPKGQIEKGGIALFDYNQDGFQDLIYRGVDDKGVFGYYLYLNKGGEDPKPPDNPAIYAYKFVKIENGRLKMNMVGDGKDFSDNVNVSGGSIITGVALYTADASFVSVDGGPLVPVKDKTIHIEGSGDAYDLVPLSLRNTFHVDFYDGEKKLIKRLTLNHDIAPSLHSQKGKSGLEYIFFELGGKMSLENFPNLVDNIDGNVDSSIRAVNLMWGDRQKKIVVVNQEFSEGSAISANPYLADGRIHIWSGSSQNFIPMAVAHEYAHNIEFDISREGLLGHVFDELKSENSPLFKFLNTYFGKDAGDHTQDSSYELFATVTTMLSGDPEKFKSKLNDQKGDKRLISALKKVLTRYRDLLVAHGKREGVAIVDRFIGSL